MSKKPKKAGSDILEGMNHAGKSTASKFASTRRMTPKDTGPSATRSRDMGKPGGRR